MPVKDFGQRCCQAKVLIFGADRDSQRVRESRFVEVSHEDVTRLERVVETAGVAVSGAREDEVGLARPHVELQRLEGGGQLRTRRSDAGCRLTGISDVPYCCGAHMRCDGVDVVAVLNLGQAGEQWQVEVPLSKFKSKTEHRPDLPIGMELTDIWVFSPEESAELEIHRVEFLPKEVGQ